MHTIIRDKGEWRVVFAWPQGGSETVVAIFSHPDDAAKLVNALNGGTSISYHDENIEWIGTSAVVHDSGVLK